MFCLYIYILVVDIYYYYTYDFIYFIKIDGKKCQDNKCYSTALQKMISFPVQTEVGDGITTMPSKCFHAFDKWKHHKSLSSRVKKCENANNAPQKNISGLVQIDGEHDRIIIDEHCRTFLSWLCSVGCLVLVELMIKNEEDVNYAFLSGDTPLMEACKNGYIYIVQILIKAGADINYASKDFGYTALYYAATFGHTHVVKYLINAGADLNFACHSNNYKTALMKASQCGKIGVVKTLIKAGADVNYVQRSGYMTALTYAARHGHIDIVIYLIKAGANVNPSMQPFETPLSEAAKNKHYKIVEILLQNFAKVDHIIKIYAIQYCTILYTAARDGDTEVVKLLLKYGAYIDALGPNKETPLFAAANNGNVDTVNLLLNKGANPSICHVGGWDPLFVAAYNGHTNIVQILQTYGAQPCTRCSKLSALCMPYRKDSQRSVGFSDILERVIVFNFNDSPNKVSIAAALAEAESAATAAESVSTVEE